MYNTINGWTKESMIEHIKANFKGKSVDLDTDECMYKAPNGAKCAIGLFIPDNLYQDTMDREPMQVRELVDKFPQVHDAMPLSVASMTSLQNRHDRSQESETLADMLDWINEYVA